MITITKQAEAYLVDLAGSLEIPTGRYEQAEQRYKSLGEWLQRTESIVARYNPDFFVQGSFRLGTVIKPGTEDEQYDIDCACVLSELDKRHLSQAALKEMLGKEIKNYRKSKGIVKEVESKRRCWCLEYADGAQFHMDIVPGIPNGYEQERLLVERHFDTAFVSTAIAITDNKVPEYNAITSDWPRSNPRGYSKWFVGRMGDVFIKNRVRVQKEMLAEGRATSIEDIPTYRVRTPLQSAIMILKHHRNTMFSGKLDNAPISIIISTLAARVYNGEDTIGYALLSILNRMQDAIEHDGQKYIILNPTDELENFADKWVEHPERASAFFDWLEQVRNDFSSVANLVEHRQISNALVNGIGQEIVNQVNDRNLQLPQDKSSSLLRTATAATPSVSFVNSPRTPKKPEGFA